MPELFLSPVFWLAVAAVLLVSWLLLRRHATPGGESDQGDSINISEFVVAGPPEGPPSVEFYGTPVRLQLIVLAPMGRRSQLPANEELPHILNHFLSGFTRLSALHRPVLFRWPEQLSAQGFHQAFFNQLSLPDARNPSNICTIYMFLAPLPCFGCWNYDFHQIPPILVIFSENK